MQCGGRSPQIPPCMADEGCAGITGRLHFEAHPVQDLCVPVRVLVVLLMSSISTHPLHIFYSVILMEMCEFWICVVESKKEKPDMVLRLYGNVISVP